MADDINGLGGLEIFPFDPNWIRTPNTKFNVSRYFQGYPGSSNIVEELTADVPVDLDLGFLIGDKESESIVIDFFNERKGRLEKFWVKYPEQQFIVKETSNIGSTILKCYPMLGESIMRGDERIYIIMHDGDTIIKEVTNVEYSIADDATILSLNTVLDRDIEADNGNHFIIAKLLLVRFGTDTLEIIAKSNLVSTASIRFHELVKEYVDI